jgi:hypothetical protein
MMNSNSFFHDDNSVGDYGSFYAHYGQLNQSSFSSDENNYLPIGDFSQFYYNNQNLNLIRQQLNENFTYPAQPNHEIRLPELNCTSQNPPDTSYGVKQEAHDYQQQDYNFYNTNFYKQHEVSYQNQYVPAEESSRESTTPPQVLPEPIVASASRILLPDSILNTRRLKVDLLDKELWRQFNSFGTEMIINKSGRFVFVDLPTRSFAAD